MFVLLVFVAMSAIARADSVVVIPFANQSGSNKLDWIGESLSESIREALANYDVVTVDRQDRLEVFKRLSIRPYAVLTRASLIKIAQALDASQVIFGQYEIGPLTDGVPAPGATLRITGRYLNLRDLTQGPQLQEFGDLSDLSSMELHLAWQTLRAVSPRNAPNEEAFRQKHPALRVDAIESYVRGLMAPTDEQKMQLFAQASRLDERYSAPCFALGNIYFDQEEYRHAIPWLRKVHSGESTYFEAQFLLGISLYNMGDFAGARDALQLVAAAVPLNEVYNNLGAAQLRLGLADAEETFAKVLASDTADPDYQFNMGYALWKRGQFEAAAERFRATLDRDPEDAESIELLGRCLKNTGPKAADPMSNGLERIKYEYEEKAYRELKALLSAPNRKGSNGP